MQDAAGQASQALACVERTGVDVDGFLVGGLGARDRSGAVRRAGREQVVIPRVVVVDAGDPRVAPGDLGRHAR
ncbi:MAG TPA: hypothetical protein VG268_16055 [Streptosporangiaceae bacterium]|nr:hypothetical protein [Streptosporangiaceae bacterium]